jgi:ketosteroid isomerase-like protein
LSLDEIRDAGDRFVALGHLAAGGRASGVELDVPLGVVGAVRNGKVVYIRFFSDPAEALEAAGLSE